MAVEPPKRPVRSTKGLPPETPSGAGITEKPGSSEQVPMNFSVDAEFRKQYKLAAAQSDMKMVDVLKESFALFQEKHGMR